MSEKYEVSISRRGNVWVHIDATRQWTPTEATSIAIALLGAADRANIQRAVNRGDIPAPGFLRCAHCGHEWETKAKAGSNIKCPACKKSKRVPSSFEAAA
ncbi:hypothetical protein [Streptomyces sp. NPDC048611]|uniref:zinc ribbon-containing protein n=1 Tax=Streptomyces sp. NPDC048611 TaxID=3155635 RepID=UPI0034492BBF